MLVCMIPSFSVFAAERVNTVNGVRFGFRLLPGTNGSSAVAALQSVETSVKNLVLPDYFTINGDTKVPLTSVDNKALMNNKTIESVKFNDACTGVGDYAFSGCTNLKTVIFGESFANIARNAFENTGIVSLSFTDNIRTIGDSAFSGCGSLVSFKGGMNLTEIGDSAFYNCPNLKSVTLGSSVSKIGDKAIGYGNSGKVNGVNFLIDRGSQADKYAASNGFSYKYSMNMVYVLKLRTKKYTGKPITQKFEVRDGSVTLVEGRDYKASYSKNIKPGYAKITITGIGMYSGTHTAKFFIKPKVVKVTKVRASVKKKKLTVRWKKLKNVSGYQIVYSAKKNFRGKKTVTAKRSASLKKINRKLKKGRYYIKVRAYKTVAGNRTYGPYSKSIVKRVK